MLNGKLSFVKLDHLKGTSQSGHDYEFANVTLSDGLDGFKLNLSLDLVDVVRNFKRGDFVKIALDVRFDEFGNVVKDQRQQATVEIVDIKQAA